MFPLATLLNYVNLKKITKITILVRIFEMSLYMICRQTCYAKHIKKYMDKKLLRNF